MNTEQQLFALMAAADAQQQAVSELIAAQQQQSETLAQQQQQSETLAQQQQRQLEWERSSRAALITLAGNNQHHLRVLVQTHQAAVEEATKQALTKAWAEADAQYLKVLESQFKHLQAQVHDSIKETQAAASYIGRYARWLRFRLAWFLGMVTLAVVLTILISLWVTVDKERQYLAELGQQRQQLQLEVGQLQTQVADLTKLGGKIKLKHCGPENRLCVRVDTENVYGPTGDYLTVKED